MNNIKNQRGFSLIELMIAVAIIGILAAIAIPNYQKFQRKSRQAEAKNNLAAIHTANKIYVGDYGLFTSSFGAMNYSPEGRILYDCGWPGDTGVQVQRDAAMRPAVPNVTLSSSRTWCAVDPGCEDGVDDIVDPGAIVGAVDPDPGPPASFIAACVANIGGAGNDQWTMDQNKELLNTADGVQ